MKGALRSKRSVNLADEISVSGAKADVDTGTELMSQIGFDRRLETRMV